VDSMRFIVVRISVVARFVVMFSARNLAPVMCFPSLSFVVARRSSGRVASRVDEWRRFGFARESCLMMHKFTMDGYSARRST